MGVTSVVVCGVVAVFVGWRIPALKRDRFCEDFVKCAEVQQDRDVNSCFDVFNHQPWYAEVDID